MLRRTLVLHVGVIVVGDAEVGAGFQPQVIRLAGVEAGDVAIGFCVGPEWEERIVEVRGGGVVHDVGPVVVLQ